ncbi:MAG: NRDE family protein [Haloarculaceae archaeon]
MCTLVFAWQVFADAPVVAAANRDEQFDRPSEPPAVVEEDPRVVAPRDREACGTWIGYNEHGVFAAITNRWTDRDATGERSRGLLVRDALRQSTAEAATRLVERKLDGQEYEGFNLVLADERAALYVEHVGAGGPRVRNFDPGVHVVVNVGADGEYAIPAERQEAGERQAESADRLATDLVPEPGERSAAWLDRAADAVGDHEYGVCVHGDGFGTRSSSLITVGREGASYRFADGPPCETEYRRVEEQL